ncbi:hypothetical protein F5890DRAFT_1558907 [Lentinula detonsa]|uniref:DUF6532 domain-containing protein n=1 Tax=Lentinula detonsa TaxID=2804962 RepID=A0AA38PPF6_9AGAR|nr:hypothetical protein F5890DRAFT_1558907 [Lentinula detonsa]
MPPKSASTLSSLLNPNGISVTKNNQPIDRTTGGSNRPSRESKSVAMQNKVWMSDGPSQLKRTLDGVSDNFARLTKKTKTISGTKGEKVTGKKVKPVDEELENFADDGEELAETEDAEENGRQGSDKELEHEEDAYDLGDMEDLDAERAESVKKMKKVSSGSGRRQTRVSVMTSDDEAEAILPPSADEDDEDRGFSDSAPSSIVELSLVLGDGEDDEDDKLKQEKPKRFRKKMTARDTKYEFERPSMAPTAAITKISTPKKVKHIQSESASASPNNGWPVEAHLVYPNGTKMQRTISLRAQPKAIQDVIHEAIILASGLSIFKEAFPTSDEQLIQSYTSVISAATSLNHLLIANRVPKDNIFSRHLTNYVTGRIGKMRVNIKDAATSVVPGMYGILRIPIDNDERKNFVKALLSKMNFIFPRNTITDPASIRLNEPYLHPAIIAVLHNFFFKGPKSLGQHFCDTFVSTIKTDDAKEIPRAMLSLVVIGVFAAIKEWEGGKDERDKHEFITTAFADQYTLHTNVMNEKILKSKVGNGTQKYHTLMARLYREAKSGTGTSSDLSDTLMPDVDFAGME